MQVVVRLLLSSGCVLACVCVCVYISLCGWSASDADGLWRGPTEPVTWRWSWLTSGKYSTVGANEKPDAVQMYMRSCEIYANGSVVADPQVVFIGDETRAHKKLDSVEMYGRSREIYEKECMKAGTKNNPVVNVGELDQLLAISFPVESPRPNDTAL